MIIDPYGKILAQGGTSEEIVFYEIGKNKYVVNKPTEQWIRTCYRLYFVDLEVAERIRKESPKKTARRVDIFKKYYEK